MTRILVYEPSLRRVRDRLPRAARDAEFLAIGDDEVIRLNGQEISPDDANPEIGWMVVELFGAAASRNFFVTLLKAPNLKWVQSAAAGFDNPAFARIVDKGARLTTNNAQAVSMSEYVLWGVLDHFQRGSERGAAQAKREWVRLPYREIGRMRWLIIGFGAIGQATAERARAFGAHITGVRRTPGDHPLADAMVTPDETKAQLPQSDVVVLLVPLSPATAGMVDADFLKAMKPGSVLVNVGRGDLVDETALLAALDAGRPEHALLDVFHKEPLPADSPFWTHPRVTLTGHASSIGDGLGPRGETLFLDNLERYLTSQPLLNEANPKDVLAG
ncbi:MAG TPA: D-2-hydroxyacid dehydrogenase [Caulobacteraceae bacterium]|jgi:phosphoglycerate dehydrogenase-like enzyme|nr:D-2-hydroxyacid dehydrogenase [Caulobacteraceae bacterium]